MGLKTPYIRGRFIVPVHGKLHFLLIIRNWFVNLMKLEANFGADIPPKRRANDTCTKEVESSFVIPKHDRKILRDVLHEYFQRMFALYVLGRSQNVVLKDPIVVMKRKMHRISRAHELQSHFHEFLALQVRTRQPP
jgi:hypothetical protein